MALPSYESIYLDGGEIQALIGPYLSLSSLRNLLLADSQAYKAFNPILWNDPMKWIVATRYPFSNTAKFMEISKRCRKANRDLVINLDLRALQALSHNSKYRRDFHRFETTLSYEWVLRHQRMFANLRILVLDGLRMGEEASVQSADSSLAQPVEAFRPLLLSYRGVHLDATGIQVLPASEKVMYLNISSTFRPDQWTRMMQQANFRNLRIIKISGMSLTDRMFPYNLLVHNALRLWSLDIRDNVLSDDFITVVLKQTGIALHEAALNPVEKPIYHGADEELYDSVPFYTREDGEAFLPPYSTLVPMREDSLDAFAQYLRSNGSMTTDPRHALPRDDIYVRPTGLTHLYLSNNRLTSNSIHELFKFENNRLQVLDVGSLQVPSKDSDPANSYHHVRLPNSVSFAVIDCAKYFKRATGTRIEKLRIHHSFVTLVPTVVQSALKQGFRLDRLEEAEKTSNANLELWGEVFKPQDNFRVRELTLTDVPTKSYGPIIQQLIAFLKLCHDQEVLLEEARMKPAQQHYRAPPLLSGLRVLKLEFLHPRLEPIDTRVSAVSSPNSSSVSGDRDADAFLSSAAGDFSFFAPSPERPAFVRARSTPNATDEQGRSVSQVKAAKPQTSRELSEGLQGPRDADQDADQEKQERSSRPTIKSKGKEIGKGGVDSITEAEVEQKAEAWPNDIIEELKIFRGMRPRWSGELLIVRPRSSGEAEGDGLMGWR